MRIGIARSRFFTPESLRSQFEHPADEQGDWKPGNKQNQELLHHPTWCIKVVQNEICYLCYQPGHQRIDAAHPYYVAAL